MANPAYMPKGWIKRYPAPDRLGEIAQMAQAAPAQSAAWNIQPKSQIHILELEQALKEHDLDEPGAMRRRGAWSAPAWIGIFSGAGVRA